MTHRVLIASQRPRLEWAARPHERRSRWHVVGIVNPREWARATPLEPVADVLLIDADELMWLAEHAPRSWHDIQDRMRAVVMLEPGQILDLAARGHLDRGLLLPEKGHTISLVHLDVALEGYMVLGKRLLGALMEDTFRLGLVQQLSRREKEVLCLMGTTFSNRALSARTGLAEAQIKATVYKLSHKLRLPNRTAVAVFAVSNGLAPTGPTPVRQTHSAP